jgi:hypothetical protein
MSPYTIGADLTPQYDRVDPTEFQSLKDEIESLRTEKSAWEVQQNKHTEELNEQLEKVIIVHSLTADNLYNPKS